MNDCAHARMWARTHEVFAEADAARREQLDRWIRESHPKAATEAAPSNEPKPLGNPFFEAGGTCLRCGDKTISTANQTGLCRDCFNATGKKTRAHFKAIRQARKGNQ